MINVAIEKLDGSCRSVGIHRYRNDFGNVVYSETEIHCWAFVLMISITKKPWIKEGLSHGDHTISPGSAAVPGIPSDHS